MTTTISLSSYTARYCDVSYGLVPGKQYEIKRDDLMHPFIKSRTGIVFLNSKCTSILFVK